MLAPWLSVFPQAAALDLSAAFQLIVTILLTVLVGISSWALRTVLKHQKELGDVNTTMLSIKQQLWGVDGTNGHSAELKELADSLSGVQRVMTRVIRRLDRIEYHLKLPQLHGEAPDTEED